MPEFLAITTRQNILEVVDLLKREDGFAIQAECDFTIGLKVIFYRLPKVVFIQDQIAGITGEKVADQVRALLDEESIRLVLLRENVSVWNSADLSFDSLIDLGLPFDELLTRFREEMNTATAKAPGGNDDKESAGDKSSEQPSTPDNALEIDPFSELFTVQTHYDWEPMATESGKEPEKRFVPDQDKEKPVFPGNEFCFEPPGDVIPFPSPGPVDAEVKSDLDRQGGLTAETSAPSHAGVVLPGEEKEVPRAGEAPPRQAFMEAIAQDAVISPPEKLENEAVPPPREDADQLNPIPVRNPPQNKPAIELTAAISRRPAETTRFAHGNLGKKGVAESKFDLRHGAKLEDSFPVHEDYGEERTLTRKMLPLLILLVFAAATYLLVFNWEDVTWLFGGKESEVVNPRPRTPAFPRELPRFFPRVVPDASYAATHPGWELYRDGGLDYLAFRENGRIRAVQVIAREEGRISDAFVKMCIRDITGLVTGENPVTRQSDDFQIETGTLRDRGEVAIYRKIPEGEIRGFVITLAPNP